MNVSKYIPELDISTLPDNSTRIIVNPARSSCDDSLLSGINHVTVITNYKHFNILNIVNVLSEVDSDVSCREIYCDENRIIHVCEMYLCDHELWTLYLINQDTNYVNVAEIDSVNEDLKEVDVDMVTDVYYTTKPQFNIHRHTTVVVKNNIKVVDKEDATLMYARLRDNRLIRYYHRNNTTKLMGE